MATRLGPFVLFLLVSCAGRPSRDDVDPLCERAEATGAGEVGEALRDCCRRNRADRLDVLVLSGGGSHGAWGVGVMAGWREAAAGPRRPDFKIVTGVSTGALMAPFLFLNDLDTERTLQEVYRTVRNRDIRKKRWAPLVPFSSSFYRQSPLRRLLDRRIPDAMIDRVRAHGDGGRRLLLVGTVDLDSGRTRVWNLSRIAAGSSPDRYRCFRDVIFASASMPVLAEPVFLDGAMHVDGGAREQLFLRNVLEPVFDEARVRHGGTAHGRPQVYVLVNGHLDVVAEKKTRNHVLPILARTLEVLIAENKVGNLLRVAATAREMGADVRVSAVPPEEELYDSYTFDPASMGALMDLGRAWGRANRWDETIARVAGEYGSATERAALGR